MVYSFMDNTHHLVSSNLFFSIIRHIALLDHFFVMEDFIIIHRQNTIHV